MANPIKGDYYVDSKDKGKMLNSREWGNATLDFSIRLVNTNGSIGRKEGRLEISRNGSVWGTICGYLWSDTEASVACRELGYQHGVAFGGGIFGQGSGPIYLRNVQCSGAEQNLSSCRYGSWGNTGCSHAQDVGVSCFNGSVKLSSSGRTDVGTVSVATDDGWLPVCDNNWNDVNAKVACKDLGFADGKALCCSKLGVPSIYAVYSWKNVNCTGRESHLSDCRHTRQRGRCPYSHGASVMCYTTSIQSVDMSFSIRLDSGPGSMVGAVQVRHLGVWGQICANTWSDISANITCKKLGFAGGVKYGPVNTTIAPSWITSLNCTGRESNIDQCVSSTWGQPVTFCNTAFALCYRSGVYVNLASGGVNYGRVEILHDGIRGTICDTYWSNADAGAVCRQLGYFDGTAVMGSYYGRGLGDIMMSGLSCSSRDSSVLGCRNFGWRIYGDTRCADHSHDASAVCYGYVRLISGDHSHGIVSVWTNDGSTRAYWRTPCGDGFTETNAQVVCRELGFEHGRVLPKASFGTYYVTTMRTRFTCTGSEASIHNCSTTRRSCPSESRTNYAAVACYNGTLSNETGLRLEGGAPDSKNFTGRVKVKVNGVWGHVCSLFWEDEDANVTCKQLGFRGGIAYMDNSYIRGPYWLTEINCAGNESSIFQCPVGVSACIGTAYAVSVLCYRRRAPVLQLSGGSTTTSGRLMITTEGVTGSVCDIGVSRNTADVACRQMGYTGGEALQSSLPRITSPVVMSNAYCSGAEDTFFMCRSSPWRGDVPKYCSDHSRDIAIKCLHHARILGGSTGKDSTTGSVQIYIQGTWMTLCNEGFDDIDARLVCIDIGYRYAKVLGQGAFGTIYYTSSVKNMDCQGNEESPANCRFNMSGCGPYYSRRYATVVCSNNPTSGTAIRSANPPKFPSRVIVQNYGINGTICADGWNDKAATVYCKELGYYAGHAMGGVYRYTYPFWMYNVTCNGQEDSIMQCKYQRNISSTCSYAAQVFCYQDSNGGFALRLADGRNAAGGRVEMSVNGIWGGVCDYSFTSIDATVVCKQLGFTAGVGNRQFNPAVGPSWIMYPYCRGTEQHIWDCRASSFNRTSPFCKSRSYIAGVTCSGRVRLQPDHSHGALQVTINDQWRLVCADGFNDVAAGVACREIGYSYGVSLSGSAYGASYIRVFISDLKCAGREMSILDCDYSTNTARCSSRKYASVVCSNIMPSGGYELSLQYNNYGAVRVKHFDTLGYICPEGFDDNEANVICRNLGFNGGFAYRQNHLRYGLFNDTRWLTNIQCDGNEAYLGKCSNLQWGNITNCSSSLDAAVYCYSSEGYNLRLTNGSAGRIEISVDGIWGTVCGRNWNTKNKAATVICKELGYNDGQGIVSQTFGRGTGPAYIEPRSCTGLESRIMDCKINWKPSYCRSHQYDGRVQCYDTGSSTKRCDVIQARLTGASKTNYGRLELFENGQWQAVCDQGFTDHEAKIACRQFGFADGKSQCCSAIGSISVSQIPVLSIKCQGTESRIEDCARESGTCPSGKYASVYCSRISIAVSGLQVRLAFRSSYYGPVEGRRYGFWGPICDVGWNDAAANVTCKQLGYKRGYVFRGIINNRKPMVLGSFKCNGTEPALADCPYGGMEDELSCSYSLWRSRMSAGVICSNHNDDMRIYLTGGGSNFGRVTISFNGLEGRVVNQYTSSQSAGVICRQLGFVDGSAYYGTLNSTPSSNISWFSLNSCTGKEKSILQCTGSWNTRPPWFYFIDVQVVCFNSVRLSNGGPAYTAQGAVELYVNGSWGVVCNHEWTAGDTSVVCRQMGYEKGFPACCDAFGSIYTKALMDRVRCTGSESSLLSCPHDAPLTQYCYEDTAGAVCYNGSLDARYSSLRLGVSGSANNTGDVQIIVSGLTGRICNDGWDDFDAKVVCRELGYTKGQAYMHARSPYETRSRGAFLTTMVNCNGEESSLNDCSKAEYGTVTTCATGHFAGVMCFDTEGIFYRLAGGSDSEGRLEASVDGNWGTICNSYVDIVAASVYCRSIGYATGSTVYGNVDDYGTATGHVYAPRIRCVGNETDLNQCPHTGWEVSDPSSHCASHRSDAVVKCNGVVKLASFMSSGPNQGPVMAYTGIDGRWYLVCDTGFTDDSAKIVCEDLGYPDGRAICCSAFGNTYGRVVSNYTLACMGFEESSAECLQKSSCDSGMYASVVCFMETDHNIDESYTFSMQGSNNISALVVVKHYDVMGRISSINWTDTEASVVCNENGYPSGLAYHHSQSSFFIKSPEMVPFWISQVHCLGNETSIADCSYKTRLELGNTTDAAAAGVVCFNDSGIQYRLADGGDNYGRVEIAVGGVWGTVCNMYWDSTEAGVLCRQFNYSDGYLVSSAAYGQGSGPIWLSFLQCKGSELFLHQCQHQGYNDEIGESGPWWNCRAHSQDAAVFCIDNVRLHTGFNKTIGAVEVYITDQWYTVCDVGFSKNEAKVVCRSLGFQDGRSLVGSVYGELPEIVGVSSAVCDGSETDFTKCTLTYGRECDSSEYVSVYCSTTTIIDTGFETRLNLDDRAVQNHGFVEVKATGIWGSVCMDESWDDAAATVACKTFRYAGGVSYLPYGTSMPMVVMSHVQCSGSESGLESCDSSIMGNSGSCRFTRNGHAGVLCYQSSGVQYRLRSGTDETNGRFEIGFDGQWGTVCDWQWDSRDARVACRALGFVDGLAIYGAKFGSTDIPTWLARVQCLGSESSILTCPHSGFNNTKDYYIRYCSNYYQNAAVQCYNKQLKFTDVRLVGGNSTAGRVEVYLEGPDQWGTICNHYWEDLDATVVCNELGFSRGTAMMGAAFGKGTGPIWMDDVGCYGTESHLADCPFQGYAIHDCQHKMDAGVVCSGPFQKTTRRTTKTSERTPKSTTIEGNPTKLPQRQSQSSDKTPAIVLPIISVLAVIGLLAGYLIYRRKRRPIIDKIGLTPTARPADSFVARFSKNRHTEDTDQPGISSIGIENPNYEETI